MPCPGQLLQSAIEIFHYWIHYVAWTTTISFLDSQTGSCASFLEYAVLSTPPGASVKLEKGNHQLL